MKIETLKDLKNLVNLMRKSGIDKIKIDSIELELGSLPTYNKKSLKLDKLAITEQTYVPGGIDIDTTIDTPDILTDEQLLMWSSTGGQHLGPGETV